MYEERFATVLSILEENNGCQRIATDHGSGKALVFLSFLPKVHVGDKVKINTTASALKLGTGGWDIVTSLVSGSPFSLTGKGHIMKARYLPSQHSVLSVDDPEHPDHWIFQQPFTLKGKKILLAELHSMIPVLVGALIALSPKSKIGVVLSDEASLPLNMSSHLSVMKDWEGVKTITVGQAFGGKEEATTIPNALQWLSVKYNADYMIISMGPGTTGTNTPWGFSGLSLANWSNLVGALEGIPVWTARISFQDERKRHRGISHHTLTPLQDFTLAYSFLALPYLAKEKHQVLYQQSSLLMKKNKHIKVLWQAVDELELKWKEWKKDYPLSLTTMGRPIEDDPPFYLSCLSAALAVAG
ncbi:DUF3866 family protein [Thalassorhabdus alkalitolerans]|uniref:DUF3866 family protein n=1 Tax=Thalassorhabdus alkalitolerans TaxID=2282697 RepID=A0ABW0YVN2_9BACI